MQHTMVEARWRSERSRAHGVSEPWDVLVMVTNYLWDGRPETKRQPPHYLASAWARQLYQPVLLVNLVPWNAVTRWPSSMWRLRPGLHRTSTPGMWMLNVFGPEWRTASHLGNRLPIREVQRKICRAMESLHLRSPLVIASEPAHCRLFEGFGAARKVWYCTDDFAADDGVKCASIRSNEAWALEHADLVMAVSQNLGDRLAPRSRSMLHFPNGVDAEELRQLAARSKPVQGWKDTMRPRIAFLGSVDNRLAYDALLLCMERHRDKSFLLIGGVYEHDETIEPHVRKLRSLPNVHFLGQRDRREVAWILSQCEVGLIPYEVNDFNRACSPLKVFEYAALGLTVIASRLPALQEFGDLVSLIDVASLADVLEREVQGAPTHSVKMRAFADANTWSHRAQFLASHLQQGIAG